MQEEMRLIGVILDHPLEFLVKSFVVLLLLSVIITLIGGIDTDEMIAEYGTGFEQVIFLAIWLLGALLVVSLHLKNKYKNGTEIEKTLAMEYLETFKVKECDLIILEYHEKMSDRKVGRTEEIHDPAEIEEVLALLKQVPETGDMMIKMGDVSLIKAFLYHQGKDIGFLVYYQSMLKLTDTSFCSEQTEAEAELYGVLRKRMGI